MKRLLVLVLLLAGCSAAPDEKTEPSAVTSGQETMLPAAEKADSWTADVRCTYSMLFPNESSAEYSMDGILTVQDEDSSPQAHLMQNFSADGLNSTLTGWYYDKKLYAVYNGVNYYDEMSFTDVKSLMLVPLDCGEIPASYIRDVTKESTDAGEVYTLDLTEEGAEKLFVNQYDFYGISSADRYHVNSGKIVRTYSPENYVVSEHAEFVSDVEIQGMDSEVTYDSELYYSDYGTAETGLTQAVKDMTASYPHYSAIDTSQISDADLEADAAEGSVTDTLKKRLVGRLGYVVQDDGTYLTEYNDGESYIFDFDNSLFSYKNRTSQYAYSWKGDTGGFGSVCSYDFETGISSSTCTEETLDMIRNVRLFLEMELYYCGLSLDDLIEK